MRGRRNVAEFKSILQKMLACSLDEVFVYAQSKYRTLGLASIRQFPKGRH
jgi:hypothetical protein